MTAHGPQTAYSQELHAEKYRERGESFEEATNRTCAALQDDDTHYHQLREVILPMRFLFGGRIQAAMGALRQTTPYNCYVSGTIQDSFVEGHGSIMQRAHEAAATMRMGGGIGYDFSTLRPRGALIRKLSSNATGPVSFMGIFDATCKCVVSSAHRRGAQMGVLRVDHPDIEEFILAKQNSTNLTAFNLSISITDEFMEAVRNNRTFALRFGGETYREVDAAALWERIMRSTWDWAEPGVLFIDAINRMNNLYYCETLAATNPCFTGDTKVWTAKGQKTFADLAATGKDVQVLTERPSDKRLVYRWMRKPRVTQRAVPLVQVNLDDGTSVRCTPQHIFYTRDGRGVEASQLLPGESLQSVYRWNANQKGYKRVGNGNGEGILEHHVPFEDVRGLGTLYQVHHLDECKDHNDPENLQLLEGKLHRQLHMTGDANPMRRFPEHNHFNSRDNKGEKNGRYRSDVSDEQLMQLRSTGLSYDKIAEQVGCSKYTVAKRLGWNHKVVSVEVLNEVEDVYCGTVDEAHRFFVALGEDDGVLVSNCGEQPLPPFGACLLGSFNLVQYLVKHDSRNPDRSADYYFNWDQFIADIPVVHAAMDNVVDRARYPLPEQRLEAVNKRRMGMGVTGLANAGEALGFPYGSPQFLAFEDRVLGTLANESYTASALRAKRLGSFPLYKEDLFLKSEFVKSLDVRTQAMIKLNGIRNSHLTSIAPTGTISLAADNVSSGVEPVFAESFDRTRQTPEGASTETVYDYGTRFLGTKPRTASQVTVSQHLDVLVTAAQRVDSAVSKTCNVPPSTPWENFKGIYMGAWERGAKGCTTFNSGGKRMGVLMEKADSTGAMCEIDPLTGRRECA